MRWWLAPILIVGCGTAIAAESPPTYVRHFGRTGPSPGMMWAPFGVCGDADGNIYVAELLGCRLQKWTTEGVYLDRWGGEGHLPGMFYHPADVIEDGNGLLWVSDRGNHRLQCFDREGHALGTSGSLGKSPGQFTSPSGLAASGGFLYVADTYNSRVQKFAIHGPSLEFVTAWGDSGTGPGQFVELQDVDVTPSGLVVVADSGNNRIQIFTNDGTLVLQFGGAVGPSRGRLSYPYGVSVDVHGNIYAAEPYRRRIQKFDANGIWQFDWGSASTIKVERLTRPLHMWIDAAGLLYVCDYDDTAHADRIVVWRPADVPTAVSATTLTRMRAAYR